MRLIFDDNDDVMAGLLSAMTEHRINEASIQGANGILKAGLGNYMNGSRFMTKNFDHSLIKAGTGHFKRSKTDLFGVLKVIPEDIDSHVTVAKAIAAQDFEITLAYYEY